MDNWYYSHQGQTHGPISRSVLQQLAVRGQLLPQDLVWAESESRDWAVEAQAVVEISAATTAPPPNWLTDVPLLARPPAPPAPEWLADVARAEQAATALPVCELDVLEEVSEAPAAPLIARPVVEAGVSVELAPVVLPPSVGPCRVSIGCATSRGRVRDRNEDRFLVQQFVWSAGEEVHEATLLVVADGMGGHQAGDRASALAISTLSAGLSPVLAGLLRPRAGEGVAGRLTQALGEALREAHGTILKVAADPACKGMGATVAVAIVCDGRVHISHVGDCRVYHQRGNILFQVTRDHTLVARMVELGRLTAEEAVGHPASNQVLQALGKQAPLQPSQYERELERGDWLIVACDGLTAHVTEDVLRATAKQAAPSAAHLARRLVELANEGGGTDNCTVVAAYCY